MRTLYIALFIATYCTSRRFKLGTKVTGSMRKPGHTTNDTQPMQFADRVNSKYLPGGSHGC